MCAIDQAYYSERPWRVTDIRCISIYVYYGKMAARGEKTVEVVMKFGIGLDAKATSFHGQ
jgi:hypothetical protein